MFSRLGAAALKPNLDNITQLCNHLGNPQNNYKIIHIAGTNGKGTISHLTASILQSQGYKVGLHVSPHYKDLRERFKVNGKLSNKKFVIDFLNKHRGIIEQIQPSFFELTVAMSFSYFDQCDVDYAVIEVGLGGRLDSTNIVMPILSVITNISMDHTELLGDTLPQIASEKAGIIKENTPVIIGEYQSETYDVFNNKAKLHQSPIVYAKDIVKANYGIQNFTYTQVKSVVKHIGIFDFSIDLSGPFQSNNITTSLAILDFLFQNKIVTDLDKLKKTLYTFRKTVNYIGRWQILGKKPTIIADSAHNMGGLQYVIDYLSSIKNQTLHIVIGFVKDKKRAEILAQLPKDAKYYFVNAQLPRALPSDELKEEAESHNLVGTTYNTVLEGYKSAKAQAEKEDFIFVGGSIFVVAEVI
jgi:dihydrofolate synthase / folylpolyglutamate synthase